VSVTRTPLEDRFWRYVERDLPSDVCWLWSGAKTGPGYGAINSGGRGTPVLAHRLSYEMLVGPIPEGLVLDHLCRVRNCVNPAHLEPVTHAENLRRVPVSPQCPHGHDFTPENTGRNPNGGRVCRTCKRSRERRSTR
jgi:hypothetical protein